MKKNSKKLLEETQKLSIKNSELHKQLRRHMQKAQDTVDLINTGSIDALVIPNKKDLKVYTETTADRTYRVLIEKMNEGAVTVDKDGTILFSNSSFANMVNLPLQKVTGAKFINFIDNSSKESFKSLAVQGLKNNLKAEANIISNDGKVIPTLLSMNSLQLENEFVLSIIITDISIRHKIQVELELKTKQLEQKYLELESVIKELAFQNKEKEVRAAELGIANKELAFQNNEKEKRAAELGIANKELAFQNNEKEKRAAELTIANKELAFQNKEKEKRATELTIANKELAFQNEEKEKRAAELKIANKELAFQNNEKEKRAAELTIANKELAFQNEEKEKRAAELIIANKELAFQNTEKEKRAAELTIANIELAFQNQEKEKRAVELTIANKELAFQNEEKEKRAAELTIANKDLTTFTFVSSHDLQEPLRKIKNFISVLLEEEEKKLSDDGKDYLHRMFETAKGMQVLIEDLLLYARAKGGERLFEKTDLAIIVEEVKNDFEEVINKNKATIEIGELCVANIIRFQFHQLFQNLFSNSFKFSKPDIAPHIIIKSAITDGGKLNNEKLLSKVNYCHITYTDNGIGFDPQYNDRIFEVFQRLNSKDEYEGTGMGLAICKRIVENHNGIITATGELNKGSRFDIYIPVE